MKDGKRRKKIVHEKQVVFWSRKYADKARAERAELVKKALELVDNPAKYNRATSYGAAKYIKSLKFDQETGAVLEGKRPPSFDHEKLGKEQRYDGYYALVTSEMDMPDGKIIDTYRGLWEIEETFKVTKSTLEARPVYVSREDRINAHFLMCFIALVIIRLIQKLTKRRYSPEKIIDCLNKISCSNEQDNLYLFDYRNEISMPLGRFWGLTSPEKEGAWGRSKIFWPGAKNRPVPYIFV